MSGSGTYTFKWEHPGASEVWVTGTFDDWKKTVQLEKKGDIFEKTVSLPITSKILYKYVVDGAWITNDSKAAENDENGIKNNVLHPSELLVSTATAAISTITPSATTLGMAGQVPKEDTSKGVPGAFIETPATEPDTFSVKPIPASDGIGNPVTLKPGEKVPDAKDLTTNTVASTVKLDKESYENADAGAAKDLVNQKDAPVVGGTIIPESSLPMGEGATPFISSAGKDSTTAQLAGAVPKEPAVPAVVTESQEAAHAAPEASANPTAVEEKKEVESELKSKVPEEPAAAQSGMSAGGIAGTVAGGAAAATAAVGAAALATKDKAVETAAPAVASAQETAKPVTDALSGTAGKAPAAAVPEVVSESIEKAHGSAEAAANPEAVAEKSAVEAQLKKEVPENEATGEPAPTASAATSETAPKPTGEAGPATTAAATDKKSKRRSVFSKLKAEFDKLRHKDKDGSKTK